MKTKLRNPKWRIKLSCSSCPFCFFPKLPTPVPAQILFFPNPPFQNASVRLSRALDHAIKFYTPTTHPLFRSSLCECCTCVVCTERFPHYLF